MRFINNYSKTIYHFLGYDENIYKIIDEIDDKKLNLSKKDEKLIKEYFNIDNIYEYFFINKDYKIIFLKDGFLKDDNIYYLYNKLANNLDEKLIGEMLFIYDKNNDTLGYDNNINPIEDLIDVNIDKSVNIKSNNYNKLINKLNKTYYFYTLKDYYKLLNIDINKEYNLDNWDKEYNLNDFFKYIIKRYWPLINNINIIKNYPEYEKTIISKINQFEKLNKDVLFFNKINKSEYINYNKEYITLLKLNINENKGNIDLIKLFNDFKLSEKYPFIKLLLNSYDDSYFKVYKPSLKLKYNRYGFIDKNLCDNFLIKGSIIQIQQEIETYLYTKNCIVIYINHNNLLLSLVINQNGDINIIFDKKKYINNLDINLNKLYDEIEIITHNTILNINKLYNLKIPIALNNLLLDKLNIYLEYNIDIFENDKGINNFNLNDIYKIIKNLYWIFRINTEKYKKDNEIYLNYKRINDYDNLNTRKTLISTMSQPKLQLTPEEIINIVSDTFNISYEDAYNEYYSWKKSTESKLSNGKNIYTISVSDPGPNINIIKIPAESIIKIYLYNIHDKNIYNNILSFISSIFNIYINIIKGNKFFNKFLENNKNNDIEVPTNQEALADNLNQTIQEQTYDSDSDLSELDFDDDEDEGEIMQFGGATNISRYYSKRLTDPSRDPELFHITPSDKFKKTYTKSCQVSKKQGSRQPIVLDEKEFEKIKKSDISQKSYKNVIKTGSKNKKLYYICPKYWDIKKNISIDTDKVNPEDIITEDKMTNKSILHRTGDYWKSANNINQYEVGLLPSDIHPLGYEQPCCYNASKNKKDVKTKIKNISNLKIGKPGSYTYLHEKIKKIFPCILSAQDNKLLVKKKLPPQELGFIKYGIIQDHNSLLTSLSTIFQLSEKKTYNTNDFIKQIIDIINNDILIFLKAGNIPQYFKKDIVNIDEKDISIFKDYMFNNKYNIFIKLNIKNRSYLYNKIKDVTNKNDFYNLTQTFSVKDNKIILYLFNIIISFENYKKYLLSNEDKYDKYIIPLFNEIYPSLNITVFEEINDNIKIKLSQNNTLPDYIKEPNIWDYYIFIYKYEYNYEPLLYRFKNYSLIKDRVNSELGLIHYNHFPNIQEKLLSIEKLYKEHYINNRKNINTYMFIDIFNHLIKLDNKDFIPKNLYLDNYNKITHLQIEYNNMIIPFFPSKIVNNYLNYKYSFIYDLNKLPTYENVIDFYKKYFDVYNIKGIIVENNYIVNIVFDNYLYLPIQKKKYNKNIKLNIIGENNLFNVDSVLYNNSLYIDKRLSFTNELKYEKYITYSVIQTFINKLKDYNKIIKLNVKDYRNFNINESYHFKLEDKIYYIPSLDSDDLFGTVTAIKIKKSNDLPYKAIISVKNNIINQINDITNHNAYINIHKRDKLYPIISSIINDISVNLKTSEFNKYNVNYNNIVCYINTKKKCNYPCKWDNNKCKLIINSNDNLLKEKIIWKIIDLLLIYNIENIDDYINKIINIDDISNNLYPNEIYFNYEDFYNGYLNLLFSFNSSYIRNINIYNEFNENITDRLQEEKLKYISNIPYFISNILGKNTFLINNYTNNDFDTLSNAINKSINLNIDSKIIKNQIISYLDENKSLIKKYKIKGDINKFYKDKLLINLYDLIIISEIYKIGILFINKQYSKIKSKFDIFINEPDNLELYDIPFILLFDKYNKKENKYYLTNINLNGKLFINYNDILNNNKLKKYLN